MWKEVVERKYREYNIIEVKVREYFKEKDF